MKIVLFTLNGSWSHTSLALRCLRAPLEAAGFYVVILEYTLRDRTAHVLERLYAESADVYGFSCYIWNLEEMLKLGEALHSILPNSRFVLGGPEVSFDTDRFAAMEWIDSIVCGEGERAFCELCQEIAAGNPIARTIIASPEEQMRNEGIFYRNGDSLGRMLYYESSRGCPYSCAYCLSSATRGVRSKSVEETLCDMKRFEALEGDFTIIKFVDRTFNADVSRANDIWRALLEDRFTKRYHFEVCATLLNEESFEILSRFPKGKIQLEFGLQSTNEKTLSASARHLRPHDVIRAVRRIYEMGNIHVHLDLIAGLPYEDYQSFATSFDDAYGISDLLQVGFLKLLYGTPLRARAEEYGYRCLSYPPYTVLENRWITYGQMQRLLHIAELLERFLESQRFTHTMFYLTPLMQSPFAFWEGFSEYLKNVEARPLQRISQPDAFRYLLQYAQGSLPASSEQTLKQMLRADFSMHEHKNPPAFLF